MTSKAWSHFPRPSPAAWVGIVGWVWGDENHPVFGMKFLRNLFRLCGAYSGISVSRHSGRSLL